MSPRRFFPEMRASRDVVVGRVAWRCFERTSAAAISACTFSRVQVGRQAARGLARHRDAALGVEEVRDETAESLARELRQAFDRVQVHAQVDLRRTLFTF